MARPVTLFAGMAPFLVAGLALTNGSSAAPARPEFVALCTGVTAGDTLVVARGDKARKKQVKIRLYGLDAPDAGQPFDIQARQILARQVSGKNLKVFVQGVDESGQLLAWVFVGPKCINVELVQAGAAWWDKKGAASQPKLAALEKQARTKRFGLWKDKVPVAPWNWRALKKPVATVQVEKPPVPIVPVPVPEPVVAPPVVEKPIAEKPIAVRRQPDLIVSKVTFDPEIPKVGQLIQPRIYYKNIGNLTARRFYLAETTNELGQAGDGLGGDYAFIEPGEEKMYLWGGLKVEKAGKYKFIFSVDSKKEVAESNEENNAFTVTLEIVE